MKIVAIIQARMNSTRFPGKTLQDVGGKPLLQRVVDRAQAVGCFDDIVIATSNTESDQPIVEYCKANKIHFFRGSLNDVLDRYCKTADAAKADVVVRLTGDCPLLDPDVTKQAVDFFLSGKYDYVSNVVERTYPDGLDTEVFTVAALNIAQKEARLPSEREHVTPFLRNHPERFRQGYLRQTLNLSECRWTVDEPRDLAFVREVYSHIGKDLFGMHEILSLLARRPSLSQINAGIIMNEGYQKSLEEDKHFLSAKLL